MKRIVKIYRRNGSMSYCVETNRIFGFIPCKWRIISYISNEWGDKCNAIFSNLEDAEQVLLYGRLRLPTDIMDKEIIKQC